MLDSFGRKIDYLRISVTDRCNLRCAYCMPAEGVHLKPHSEILSYEQIRDIAAEAIKLGIRKIRLTGGEPLIRKDIVNLVAMLSGMNGLADLALTTNGILLADMAASLQKAGLRRVNISLDTLNQERYALITRGGNITCVLAGIDAAIKARLHPIKINMVVLHDTDRVEISDMERFCQSKGLILQLIRHFSISDGTECRSEIPTHRPPPCQQCNRLRLTADGWLKPCLRSDIEVRVKFDDIRGSILNAVQLKPECGTRCRTRQMSAIGG